MILSRVAISHSSDRRQSDSRSDRRERMGIKERNCLPLAWLAIVQWRWDTQRLPLFRSRIRLVSYNGEIEDSFFIFTTLQYSSISCELTSARRDPNFVCIQPFHWQIFGYYEEIKHQLHTDLLHLPWPQPMGPAPACTCSRDERGTGRSELRPGIGSYCEEKCPRHNSSLSFRHPSHSYAINPFFASWILVESSNRSESKE